MPGGCSWTKNWLDFDNSYFKRLEYLIKFSDSNTNHLESFMTGNFMSPAASGSPRHNTNTGSNGIENVNDETNSDEDEDDSELLWLPTDQALYDSPEFRPYFIKYANNNAEFFHDYTIAHMKMSELGAVFKPDMGICIPLY